MATNRADTLDPALLRPGRLDRKIEFPLPDRRQKRLIFQVGLLAGGGGKRGRRQGLPSWIVEEEDVVGSYRLVVESLIALKVSHLSQPLLARSGLHWEDEPERRGGPRGLCI